MHQSSRTFRIFVSSTFSDFEAERNALQERVFPRLCDLATTYNCSFQAIDLRWGVSTEATHDQQTMKICLGEVERCQKTSPHLNFIFLLGDRYGWCPLPAEIPINEFEKICQLIADEDKELLKQWYKRDDNAIPPAYLLQPRSGQYENDEEWKKVEDTLRHAFQNVIHELSLSPDEALKYVASATEQEIVAGALNVADAHEHVFGFFREIENLPQDKSSEAFRELDEIAATKQKKLKARLKQHLSNNIHEYKNCWQGKGPSQDYIEQLCKDVYAELSKIIMAEGEKLKTVDLLEREISAHKDFGAERASIFIGRENILKAISHYIARNDPHPLVVWGESGSGKSALMAKAVEQANESGHNVICRFIGATAMSSDGRMLLKSLCTQILEHYGVDKTTIPSEFTDVVQEFSNCLALARTENPLILFLDALDQLSDVDITRKLAWIPADLPPNVHLIISTLPGKYLQAISVKIPEQNRLELQSLSLDDGKAIFKLWLDRVHRKLQKSQEEYLLKKFEKCTLPLYLKLVFEEARAWKSYDELQELSDDVPGVLHNLFERLSRKSNHGNILVSHSLKYLAASQYGLGEDELLDVLSRDLEVYRWFLETTYHIPEDLIKAVINYLGPEQCVDYGITGSKLKKYPKTVTWFKKNIMGNKVALASFLKDVSNMAGAPRLPIVLWSRLYFDLRPYLAELSVDNASLLTYYHPMMKTVVGKEYLSGKSTGESHQALAAYFQQIADPQANRSWRGQSSRALNELPYHVRNSKHHYHLELEELLADICYLHARTSFCNIWQLLDDFVDVKGDSGSHVEQYYDFIHKHAQSLHEYRGQLIALLYHEGFESARDKIIDAMENRLLAGSWFRTEKLEGQKFKGAIAHTQMLETIASLEFQHSIATELAVKAKIAFHVIRLGMLGIVDVERSRTLDQSISIREVPPLALFSSPDARYVAVAYENREMDILELKWSNQKLIHHRTIETLCYQLPQFEAPAMYWDKHCLVFQGSNGAVKKYEANSGRQITLDLPEELRYWDLRSLATLDHSLILAMSSENASQLLLLEEGNGRQVVQIENTDVNAVCTCGPSRVAAAFSNSEIRVFGISGKMSEIVRIKTEEMPTCMGYDGESLIFATNRDSYYIWNIDQNNNPLLLQSNKTHSVSKQAQDIAITDDGTLLSISRSTVSILQITLGDEKTPGVIIALFQTPHSSFAVKKNEKAFLLVDLSSGNETHLAENSGRTTRFNMDGLGNLLYACSDGSGCVLKCTSGIRCRVNGIPSTLEAVAGDPQGGFWIADRLGCIHRLETDGSLHLIWEAESNYSRVQELLCTDNKLIWRGWCDSQTSLGESRPETLMFFELDHYRKLRHAGRRLFYKADGFIETVAYDSIKDSLIVIVDNSASDARGIKAGSIEDYIVERESKNPLDWICHNVSAATFGTNSCFYLLSADGSIYCADANTWKRRAVLSPSIPFQVLSTSCVVQDCILLSDSNSNSYICRMENMNG